VSDVGLGAAFDREVWDYAQAHDLVLVSQDADFSEIGQLLGFPPKVVWIRRGNCSTADVEALRRQHREAIDMFAVDTDNSVLAGF
jgi:predicted nuclease of predicted toxin-antitoxin system